MADVHLSTEQRRALRLLLSVPRGLTEIMLLRVHSFTPELLTELVRLRLSEATTGTVMRGGRTMRVDRVRIADAGRRAIGGAEPDA